MSAGAAMESRIAEIEAKLSLAEDLVEQLNRTVYRQQQQIDLLRQELRVLYRQLRDAQPVDSSGPTDEVLPHY
jgi:SlyX protein